MLVLIITFLMIMILIIYSACIVSGRISKEEEIKAIIDSQKE